MGSKMGAPTPVTFHETPIFLWRFVIVFVVGGLCFSEPWYLPAKSVAGLMTAMAQAHFLLSYLYQFRAGKMNRGYALRYGWSAMILFTIGLIVSIENLIEALTAAYFIVHFFYDERHLLREKANFAGWKIFLPAIAMLGGEVIYRYSAGHPVLPLFLVSICSAAYIVWRIILVSLGKNAFQWRDLYFVSIFSVAALLSLSGKLLPGPINTNAINFIILVHFSNWYLSYILKFKSDRGQLQRFFLETMLANLAMGALMLALINSSFSPSLAVLAGFLFLRPYFHIWTILHYVATFRPTDLRNWVPSRFASLTRNY